MRRLLVIGIDSLAPALLEKFGDDLPNFSKLRRLSPRLKLESVFPVDSIPAWVSIYTGLNPARHGIVYSFDIFESSLGDILNIDSGIFKGKTFWDCAGSAGKKVCVLFPMLAYPPWEVNGVMVSRSLAERRVAGQPEWVVSREARACPPWVMAKYGVPPFMKGVYGKHPGKRNLARWAHDAGAALLEEVELGLKLCRNLPWDMFFISLSWLDIIQHRLWRFSEKEDPTYPGETPYKSLIHEFYRLLDQVVGEFLSLTPDASVILFSDHGHGIRPARVVNVNRLLYDAGLLFSKNTAEPLRRFLEAGRNEVLELACRLELDNLLVKLSTRTKGLSRLSKAIYMSTASLDMKRTVAYLSSFAGVKSYSHGGIEINRGNMEAGEYEGIRDIIVKEMLSLAEPGTGERLVKWALRREELYRGERVCQAYPDIVFELKDGYGTGWGLHSPLIGRAYDHNLASGGHQKDAVLLLANVSKMPVREEATLMDIAPTILDLLGVEGEFDGRSLFRK